MVKIYNPVPAEAEASWQQTMLREYAEYCRREEAR
jgi:hypothetical protein